MNKVIIITGGSRGIGAATALLAAEQGYKVGITYREQKNAAEEIVGKIISRGGEAVAIKCDVSREEDIVRMFQEFDERIGRLTALVNNAGVLKQGKLLNMDAVRLRWVFEANVIGSFICAREAVKRMAKSNGGHGGTIVNVSSMASKHGSPNEYIDYAASKGAIDTFTMGLAKEVAVEGIRVNAVRPGLIHTDIHASGGEPGRIDRLKDSIPLRRGGYPEEVAKSIMFLVSEDSSYSTGIILDVSGGK